MICVFDSFMCYLEPGNPLLYQTDHKLRCTHYYHTHSGLKLWLHSNLSGCVNV